MLRALTILLLLVAGLVAGPASAAAQRRPELRVELAPRPEREAPLVRAVAMLGDTRQRDLLRNGFPLRLHYRLELWSTGGWVNDFEGSTEWDVVVRFDPLGKVYEVARVVDDRVTLLGRHSTIEGAERAVERPYRAPLMPTRHGRRYYYAGTLAVDAVSVSDLDEVERWLRGELRPAVRGERHPGTAVTRGLRTLLARIVGGETRQYQGQSPTFRAP